MRFLQKCMDPHGHVQGKFIAIITTVALVFTMCNIAVFAAIGNNNDQAQEVSTQAGEDTQDKSQVKQEAPSEAVVDVDAGNGYITYGGAKLDGKSDSFKAPYAEPLTLKASANEGYELESVTVTSGGQTKSFTGGSITIPADMVTNDLKVTLSTAKKESASKDSAAATPIAGDKSDKADKIDQNKIDKKNESNTDTDKANHLPEGTETKGNDNSGNTDESKPETPKDEGNNSATTPGQNGEGSGAGQNTGNNGATEGEGNGGGLDVVKGLIDGAKDFAYGFVDAITGADRNAEDADVEAAALTNRTIKVGDSIDVKASYRNSGYTWTSSDSSVASVEKNRYHGNWAKVTGNKPGMATITVSYSYTSYSESFVVTVAEPIAATSITITGDETVVQFSSTPLTATIEPTDADGTVAWSSSNEEILTVDQSGNVTGVRQGTATVMASIGDVSDSKQITVTKTEVSSGDATVYYLLDPTKNANSNDTNQWGPAYGTATVNVENATWDGDKNCFDNVDQRVVSWPNGTNVIPRNSGAWNQIFNNYQSTIQKELPGISVTADDVEEIALVPAKISKNNGTNPDMHLDCNVSIKCKGVALVKYMLRDAGSSEYIQLGSKNYTAGSETQPSDVGAGYLPETKVVNDVTYTFSGWYFDQNYTQPVSSFPYKVNETTTFYAKYVGGFQVAYKLDGGAWDTAYPLSYIAPEGSTQMVKPEPKREGYKFTGWTVEGLSGTSDVSSGSIFTMPSNNVTITANWEEQLTCKVNYLEYGTNDTLITAETLYGEPDEEVTAEVKTIDGYHYVSSDPEGGKLNLVEGENVINLYYEKDAVSYTVNYYLNNTETSVADPDTFSAAWGTKVEAANLAKPISGHTVVPVQTESIVLERGVSKSINVYYYENVVLTANSDEKTYNGEEQTVTGFTGAPDGSDFSAVDVGAKGIDAGNYSAEFPARTVGTVDRTGRYIVTEAIDGALVIKPVADKVTVTITGNSAEKTYNGELQTVNGYNVSIDNLLYEEANFTFSGEAEAKGTDAKDSYYMGLNAGQFSNKSINFENVTFIVTDGKLTINPRPVTLVSADLTKEYDGTPLINGDKKLATESGWVDGQGATYTFTGSQTIVGESNNAFDYAAKKGTNFDNYAITATPGKLKVKDRTTKFPVTVKANSTTATYDGKEHTATGVNGDAGYKFEANGQTYTIEGLATSDPKSPNVCVMENTISGTAVVKDAAGNVVTDQFNVTTENGKLTVSKREITIKPKDATKVYNGDPLVATEWEYAKDSLEFVGDQGIDNPEYDGSQTAPGTSNSSIKKWGYKSNTNEENYYVHANEGTLTVTSRGANETITVNAKSAKVPYDGSSHAVKGLETSEFTINGKKYTVSGLETQNPEGTDVGTYPNNITGTAVVTDIDGKNVTSEFEVKTENGSLVIDPAEVTIKPEDAQKVYDRTALVATKFVATGLVGEDTIMGVTYGGSQTEVGENVSSIAGYELKGESKNYNVTCKTGKLKVTPVTDKVTVTIKGHKDTKAYNGNLQNVEGYVVEISNDLYKEVDFSFEGNAKAEGTNAGNYFMGLKSDNFKNLNSNFTEIVFIVEDGSLTITPKGNGDADITAEILPSLEYNGLEQKQKPVVKDGDNVLVKGRDYKLSYSGDLINVGTVIVTVEGIGNYAGVGPCEVSYRIDPCPLFVKTLSDEKTYDGKALTAPGEFEAGPVNGETATVKTRGSQTKVGSSKNYFDCVIWGTADPKNYTVLIRSIGTLTVTDKDVFAGKVITKTHEGLATDNQQFNLGDTVTFTITAKNIYAESKTMTIHEIEGVELEQSVFENVQPGASITAKATYKIQEKDVRDGIFVNTATVSFSETNNTWEASDNVIVASASPKLTVTKRVVSEPAGQNGYGLDENIRFEVTVTNNGNVTVSGINIVDELRGAEPEGSVPENFTLAPGKSVNAYYNYAVAVTDIVDRGYVENTATAEGTAPNGSTVKSKPGKATVNTVAPNAHLKVIKETISQPANQNGYVQGETIKYKVTVTNDGNLTVKGINITDQLHGVVHVGGELRLNTLAPNEKAEAMFEYTVTAEDVAKGEVVNTATASGESAGGSPTVDPGSKIDPTYNPPAPTPTYENPSMVITKTASITSGAKAGDTITYNVTVRNNGDCDLTNVNIVDPLTGDKWNIDKLAVNATQSFTTQPYTVTTDDMKAGQVVNTATGTADNPTGKPTNVTPGTATTYIDKINASWTIDKSVTSTPANGSFYKKGEAIFYQIVVTNTGNVDLTDIELKDSLVNLGAQGSIDKLAPGETRTITYDYKVTAADVSKGKVVNSVTGTATGPDPVKPGGDRDDVNTGEDSPKPTPTPSGDNTKPVAPGGGNGGNGGTGGNVVTPTTPVAPVTPGMTETPSGETSLDANETPLAPADADAHCWVHWWIIVFILLTLVYGCAVLIRRNGNSRELQEQQDRLLRKDDEQAQR